MHIKIVDLYKIIIVYVLKQISIITIVKLMQTIIFVYVLNIIMPKMIVEPYKIMIVFVIYNKIIIKFVKLV